MRLLAAILLILTTVGCTTAHREKDWMYQHHVLHECDTSDLTWIIEEYVAELKHEKLLFYANSMVCNDHYHHPKISLELYTQDLLEMCAARQLFVDVVEGLLFRLNNRYVSQEFRPSPFTSDDLDIRIRFESYYGKYVDPFYIGWIAMEEGMVYYYAFTLYDRERDIWHDRTEPYFKSRSIAFAQREAESKYRLEHPEKIRSHLTERFEPKHRRPSKSPRAYHSYGLPP